MPLGREWWSREGARGIKGLIDCPRFDSPAALRRYVMTELREGAPYNPMNAIGVSKLMSALWTRKLAQLEAETMTVVCRGES